MTNLLAAAGSQSVVAAPVDEMQVRSTLDPIRTDGELAEAQHEPDWNELDTDESGQLMGLSPRGVGSDTHDTVKYVPWWTQLASAVYNIVIDRQVASSGTAAAREETGIQGHGTMQYEVGIEPIIRDGAAFGNDYFASHPAGIQEGAGRYMQPDPTANNWATQVAAANAAKSSRQAYQSTLYKQFLEGL